MPITHLLVIFVSAVAAGAINSIAGGGTLLSFPTLIFVGVPALIANATNTMALFPGSLSAYWKYRGATGTGTKYILWLVVPSIIGGFLGALMAVHLGDKGFERLIPWLVLVATLLFILQEPIRHIFLKGNTGDLTETSSSATLIGVSIFQLVVSFYGGFFGGGVGILMLASLGFLGIRDVHKLNGLKNLAAFFINGSAAILFAVKREIDWPIAALMTLGAIAGGYLGATVAQKLPQKVVKSTITVIGVSIAIVMFIRELHNV